MQVKVVVVISPMVVSVSLTGVELDAEEAVNHKGETIYVGKLLDETHSCVYNKVRKMNSVESKSFGNCLKRRRRR